MAVSAPRGLEAKGKRLWKDITSNYELRADELDTLEDICREADLIVLLEKELDGADLIVTGSQGQDVANPMISELRQHRATKKALWASLKLPDEGGATAGNQQREAAQSRWAQSRGKVS
ncbi:hypothetical protein [Arthrobacter sp. D2-10]